MTGTAAAVAVALWLSWRSRRDAARDAEIRDLDETRRLLVVVLALRDQPSAEFVGTVAHALAKHSKLADLDTAIEAIVLAVGRFDDRAILGWIDDIDGRLAALG